LYINFEGENHLRGYIKITISPLITYVD